MIAKSIHRNQPKDGRAAPQKCVPAVGSPDYKQPSRENQTKPAAKSA